MTTTTLTIKQKILELLRDKPNSSVAEMPNIVGAKYNVVSAYLGKLKWAGFITNPTLGHYILTEKGLKYLSDRRTDDKSEELQPVAKASTSQPVGSTLTPIDIDLENITVISVLKQRYGKKRLLTILDNIKKVIE